MPNPLLDLMRQGESGAAGYNAYNRGTYVGSDGREHIRGADRPIDFSRLTVGQVQDLQHAGRQDPDRLFAVGKYQIIPQTMDGGIRALNIDRNTPFTPALQDRVFSEYLIVGKRPAIHDYITGQNGVTLPQAQHALSLEWASFGDPSRGGRSHYGGANHASITLEQSASALNQMRTDYQRDIAAGMTPDAAWRAVTSAGPQTQTQTQTPAQPQGQTQTPTQPQPVRTQTPGSGTHTTTFANVMETVLPPQNGTHPHTTGHFGDGRAARPGVPAHSHGGVDFNYSGGGQTALNQRHPTVHAPVSGVVESVGGSFGMVSIRDANGDRHQILHMNSQSVRPGQTINAGDPIGTMGGRGPTGANQYAQHVHYQIRKPDGHTVNPETYWNGRTVSGSTQTPGTQTQATTPNAQRTAPGNALADGVLKQGERGDDVLGMQRSLNRLGVRDANGRPLKEDGDFGDHTREAVTAYQRANRLKVDGQAGPETLGSIGRHLPPGQVTVDAKVNTPVALTDPAHPDHGLHTAIRRQLPASVSDDVAASVTAQTKQAGINDASKLQSVTVQDNTAFVSGTTPGFRAKVDLAQPAPSLEQTSAQLLVDNATPQKTQDPPQVASLGR